MKKLTTLAIFCLCSSLLANEGAVSIVAKISILNVLMKRLKN